MRDYFTNPLLRTFQIFLNKYVLRQVVVFILYYPVTESLLDPLVSGVH